MNYGHFDDKRREYVITNPRTPTKWINYIGTLQFGGFVDHTGGALICAQDPALNRITKYITQFPASAFNGETLYLRIKHSAQHAADQSRGCDDGRMSRHVCLHDRLAQQAAARGAEPLHEAALVDSDGVLAEAEETGDLLRLQAVPQQCEDLTLTWGEWRKRSRDCGAPGRGDRGLTLGGTRFSARVRPARGDGAHRGPGRLFPRELGGRAARGQEGWGPAELPGRQEAGADEANEYDYRGDIHPNLLTARHVLRRIGHSRSDFCRGKSLV